MKQLEKLSVGILLVIIVSCNQINSKNEPLKTQEGWKTLNENDYSIQYPSDWTLQKPGQNGAIFFIISEQTSSQDQFRENVNLLIQDLTGMDIDMDKYVQISEDQIKLMATNANLIESSRQSANGINFHKEIYTFDQGIITLHCEQYYWIRNNKAYVLTLTCEADKIKTYKETGEKILNSFVFK